MPTINFENWIVIRLGRFVVDIGVNSASSRRRARYQAWSHPSPRHDQIQKRKFCSAETFVLTGETQVRSNT